MGIEGPEGPAPTLPPAVAITSATIDPTGPFKQGASFTVTVRGTPGGKVESVLEFIEPREAPAS